MVSKTKAIILKRTKYGDKNFICQAYTHEFGKLSFFARGTKSKTKNLSPSMLEPASILELILHIQDPKPLHKLIDAQWDFLYTDSEVQVQKNCVLIFIIDMLNHAVQLPEKNEYLFDYTITTLKFIDHHSVEDILNIPLFFTYNLLQILGHDFSVEITEQIIIQISTFYNIQLETIEKSIAQLKNINSFEALKSLHLSPTERRHCLEILLWHFVYSIQNFSIPVSLNVIKKILYT